MIIVAGQMTANPAVVADMIVAIAAMRPKVLGEPGCHYYSLLMEDAAGGLCNVLEMWADDEALAVHLTQPWIQDFRTRFAAHILGSTVQVYDVAAVRPVPY